MKKFKILFFILSCVLFLLMFCGCGSKPDPREAEIIQLVRQSKYNEAFNKTDEIFKGEDKKIEEMKDWINRQKQRRDYISEQLNDLNSTPSDKLEIQPGWENILDGDYRYITGRVKNVSDENITYFKLVAEFLDDKGNVLDTDYTNSGETIRPGSMKEFKIMHKDQDEYKKVRLFIEEVNVE